MNDLELWGGAECTINRVGNVFINQSQLTGHDQRHEDITLFHQLGIKALRTPLLWEDYAAQQDKARWWAEQQARLETMRSLGIKPIVTLVHHGSGPAGLDLLNADFADQLASYADMAAAHFPWVESWTPVNEPLTTARFSALYGIWYPHKRDERCFFSHSSTK